MLLLRRLRDDTLMIVASVILCWVAYLIGEAAHVSGVIATVVAGLVYGWYQHTIMSAAVRMRGAAVWHLVVFVFEAMIFILIGFSLRGVLERTGGIGTVATDMALPVIAVIGAMTLARFAWIFGNDGILALLNRLAFAKHRPLGARAATVMSWAGMRGGVTLAVALTLPDAMPGRDLMLVTAFAAIVFTVIVQGMTLGLVIRSANLRDEDPPARLNMEAAEAAIARAQFTEVEAHAYSPDGTLLHPLLLENYKRRAEQIYDYSDNDGAATSAGINAHFDLVIAAVTAGRRELVRLHLAGDIDDDTLHDLERDLDLEELAAESAKIK